MLCSHLGTSVLYSCQMYILVHNQMSCSYHHSYGLSPLKWCLSTTSIFVLVLPSIHTNVNGLLFSTNCFVFLFILQISALLALLLPLKTILFTYCQHSSVGPYLYCIVFASMRKFTAIWIRNSIVVQHSSCLPFHYLHCLDCVLIFIAILNPQLEDFTQVL